MSPINEGPLQPPARRAHEPIVDIRTILSLRANPLDTISLDAKLLCGSPNPISFRSLLEQKRANQSHKTTNDVVFEAADMCAYTSGLEAGATIVEWTKTALIETRGSAGRADWETLKARTAQGKVSRRVLPLSLGRFRISCL